MLNLVYENSTPISIIALQAKISYKTIKNYIKIQFIKLNNLGQFLALIPYRTPI